MFSKYMVDKIRDISDVEAQEKEKIKGTPKEVWNFIKSFGPLLLLVLAIRCVVFSPFKIFGIKPQDFFIMAMWCMILVLFRYG